MELTEFDSPIKRVNSEPKRVLFNPKTYWNNNIKLPVYDNPGDRIDTVTAAQIILNDANEEMLCTMQPTCVNKNALFVVDLEKLRDPKDITCDDMGSWRANGTHPVYLTKSRSGMISIIPLKQAVKGKVKDEMYKMIKRYYYHKTAKDLNKTIFLIQGNWCLYILLYLHLSLFYFTQTYRWR